MCMHTNAFPQSFKSYPANKVLDLFCLPAHLVYVLVFVCEILMSSISRLDWQFLSYINLIKIFINH